MVFLVSPLGDSIEHPHEAGIAEMGGDEEQGVDKGHDGARAQKVRHGIPHRLHIGGDKVIGDLPGGIHHRGKAGAHSGGGSRPVSDRLHGHLLPGRRPENEMLPGLLDQGRGQDISEDRGDHQEAASLGLRKQDPQQDGGRHHSTGLHQKGRNRHGDSQKEELEKGAEAPLSKGSGPDHQKQDRQKRQIYSDQ